MPRDEWWEQLELPLDDDLPMYCWLCDGPCQEKVDKDELDCE